jgi:tRNA pseudouridine38-40 synthase
MGSGRTDTGVHAEHQVAHFDLPENIDLEQNKVLHSLRGLLKHDILVSSITSVSPEFHARFDATSRMYRYQISTQNNVFRDQFNWVVKDLDHLVTMIEAANYFNGEHDFTSFCKQNPDVNHNRCVILNSSFTQNSDYEWHYHIQANRFLHHMVRSIVSSLVLIGRGRNSAEDVKNWLDVPNKSNFKVNAPANALFLEKVIYSE